MIFSLLSPLQHLFTTRFLLWFHTKPVGSLRVKDKPALAPCSLLADTYSWLSYDIPLHPDKLLYLSPSTRAPDTVHLFVLLFCFINLFRLECVVFMLCRCLFSFLVLVPG